MLLILPLVVPLVTALVVGLFPQRLRQPVATAAVVAHLVMSGMLLHAALGGAPYGAVFGSWPFAVGIRMQADVLTSAMLVVSGILFLATFIWRAFELRPEPQARPVTGPVDIDVAPDPDSVPSDGTAPAGPGRPGGYQLAELRRPRAPDAGLLALLAACSGAYLARDLFNLYVWFEVLVVSSFLIIAIETGRKERSAWRGYLSVNVFSSILFVLGIAFLVGRTGALDFAAINCIAAADEPAAWGVAWGLIATAFLIKSAAFPAGVVLGQTYPGMRWPTAALFGGLLTKVGVYSLLRLNMEILPTVAEAATPLLVWLACLTMLFGVFGAAASKDAGAILSHHVVSQVGYLLLGVSLGSPLAVAAAIFYMLHHMLVKAALYFACGLGELAVGRRKVGDGVGVLQRDIPAGLLFALPAASLAGIPLLSGFWAKMLLINGAVKLENWLAVAFSLLVGALTLYSMVKLWSGLFATGNEPGTEPDGPAATGRAVELPTWRRVGLWVPSLLLVACTLWVGLMPGPLWHVARTAMDQVEVAADGCGLSAALRDQTSRAAAETHGGY